jgi:Domain of unknown function (DUF4912)
MTKRKTKRNAARSRARRGFQICKNPLLHIVDDASVINADYRAPSVDVHLEPTLFAIARDPYTVLASWNIDWRSMFEKALPADRQVHLRAIHDGDAIETTVTVEPMSQMQYLTISGLHKSYRLEIGYFQPFDTWHSVARSHDVEMPPHESLGFADVDLATIPFHLNFQHLANFFRGVNDISVARVVSDFQKRVSSGDKFNEATRSETEILRNLNLSRSEIAAAAHNFKKIDTEELTRRARAMLSIRPDQPSARIPIESSWS